MKSELEYVNTRVSFLRNIFNCQFLQLKIYYICRCLSMLTSDQDYKKDTPNITNNRYSHGN
jgi:hypothetical protein